MARQKPLGGRRGSNYRAGTITRQCRHVVGRCPIAHYCLNLGHDDDDDDDDDDGGNGIMAMAQLPGNAGMWSKEGEEETQLPIIAQIWVTMVRRRMRMIRMRRMMRTRRMMRMMRMGIAEMFFSLPVHAQGPG